MTLAEKVRAFQNELSKMMFYWVPLHTETGVFELVYTCDPDGEVHSMRCARLAARATKLPTWIIEEIDKHFPCSCSIDGDEGERLLKVLIEHAENSGDTVNAELLRQNFPRFLGP